MSPNIKVKSVGGPNPDAERVIRERWEKIDLLKILLRESHSTTC